MRSCVLAAAFLISYQSIWAVGHAAARIILRDDFPASLITVELYKSGIGKGDRVASIGDTIADHYWAHLAGVTIVAEVPADGVATFLASSPEQRREVLRALAQTGAKAVLAADLPSTLVNDGWQRIAHTNYFVLYLRNDNDKTSAGAAK